MTRARLATQCTERTTSFASSCSCPRCLKMKRWYAQKRRDRKRYEREVREVLPQFGVLLRDIIALDRLSRHLDGRPYYEYGSAITTLPSPVHIYARKRRKMTWPLDLYVTDDPWAPITRNGALVLQKKMGTWNPASGICPYGHPITECGRPSNLERDVPTWQCKYRIREMKAKSGYVFTRPLTRPTPLPVEVCFQEGSLKHAGYGYSEQLAMLTLVCSHELAITRTGLNCLDQTFYCRGCDDWKKAHEVSGIMSNRKSVLVWPLEEAPVRPRWVHSKRAGSGRA